MQTGFVDFVETVSDRPTEPRTVAVTLSGAVNASLVRRPCTLTRSSTTTGLRAPVLHSGKRRARVGRGWTLTVALSAASSHTVTVQYAVTGGTATGGGVDYALASGSCLSLRGDVEEHSRDGQRRCGRRTG